jgi:agmatinase
MIFDSLKNDTITKKGVYLLGFPFDQASSFRKGARKAPSAVRKVSEQMETYSPNLDSDLTDFTDIYDLGDLKSSKKLFELTSEILSHRGKLLLLGGDHSVSLGAIRGYLQHYKKLLILHLDAHADLRESYMGNPYSHACIIRRVSELMRPSQKLIQLGIRSGIREEFMWMKNNHTLLADLKSLLDFIDKWNSPIYMTLDVDFFDPGFLPGTGTPEAGGHDFDSFLRLIKLVSAKNFVGGDIVELAPDIDKTGNSTIFVCKLVREVLLALRNSL